MSNILKNKYKLNFGVYNTVDIDTNFLNRTEQL